MKLDLSPAKQRRLQDLEEVIERGLKAFWETGAALEAVYCEFYEGDEKAFGSYCRKRWKFTRRRADQFRAAAQVIHGLKACGTIVLPKNEAQTRELVGLSPEEGKAILETLDAEGRITADAIARLRDVVAKLPPEQKAKIIGQAESKAREEAAQQIGGEQRAARLAKGRHLLEAAIKIVDRRARSVIEGLGPEYEPILPHLDAAKEAIEAAKLKLESLPAA